MLPVYVLKSLQRILDAVYRYLQFFMAVFCLYYRGAMVNWEGPNDMSPLHQAAANRDKSIAQILLANGANVRAKDCEL